MCIDATCNHTYIPAHVLSNDRCHRYNYHIMRLRYNAPALCLPPSAPQVVAEALERQALHASDQGSAVARYQLAADFLLTWDEWRRAAAAHLGLARRLRAKGMQDSATLAAVQAAYGESYRYQGEGGVLHCCALVHTRSPLM
jgi:hypothetical protein